jgi:flagellar P-ring protein FlgI
MAFLGFSPGLAALLALLVAAPASLGATIRLKELVEVQGVRDNDLFGYGLVVGLGGSGDTEQVVFTSQAIAGMLGRFGARIDRRDIRVRNVATVMVTARLPTFSRPGTHLDVSVSSLGNARSLAGGVLLITPLTGADGVVYAIAQGPVQVGGHEAGASGSFTSKNTPTSGRVPAGATVEKAVTPQLTGPVLLGLKRPDFTTASRIAKAIDVALGAGAAKALDPAAVEVKLQGDKPDAVDTISKLEALEVDADERARVVVSERTGTVVAGARVRDGDRTDAHGGLTVNVLERPLVSQPAAFGRGTTTTVTAADVNAVEARKPAVALPATTTVDELVKALNLLGTSPRDLVAILQAIKAAGALDADLEVL